MKISKTPWGIECPYTKYIPAVFLVVTHQHFCERKLTYIWETLVIWVFNSYISIKLTPIAVLNQKTHTYYIPKEH